MVNKRPINSHNEYYLVSLNCPGEFFIPLYKASDSISIPEATALRKWSQSWGCLHYMMSIRQAEESVFSLLMEDLGRDTLL